MPVFSYSMFAQGSAGLVPVQEGAEPESLSKVTPKPGEGSQGSP